VLFVCLAAAGQDQHRRQQQKKIESSRANFHSDNTKPQQTDKVKTLMGKQLNKAIKRQRREKYIKRKTARIKAKKPAAKKA
jgi:hypothetical protein